MNCYHIQPGNNQPFHKKQRTYNKLQNSNSLYQVPDILLQTRMVIFLYSEYGHENEMYKEGVNLKRGKDVCMRELRECGGRTEDKTKCAKG